MQAMALASNGANHTFPSGYIEKNSAIFRGKPIKKSKYTSISKLEGFLEAAPGKMVVSPKIKSGKAIVMQLDEAILKMPKLLGEISAKEEEASDQFEAFVNSNFNSGFVIIAGTQENNAVLNFEIDIPNGACTKYFLIIEEGAQANIAQEIKSNGNALYSETVYLGQSSKAGIARIHLEGKNAIIAQQCVLEKDSALENNNTWVGGKTIRASVRNILEGEGSSAKEYSILLARGAQHFDINYSSIHRAPSSESHCIFNSALRDESRNVFDGMIRIEEAGAKTNALLECHSMILGDKASSNQIPGLEILTDDVKATHSATVARIDEDEMFYLQSRGLPMADAKKMVVKSFLESVVYKMPIALRPFAQQRIDFEA